LNLLKFFPKETYALGAEVKKMAELLKSGATMLSETCPECGTVLFKVGDGIICAKCNKPVVIVKATEEAPKVIGERVLEKVEQTIYAKIRETNDLMAKENDADRLIQLGTVLSNWLTALEKIRKLKGSAS